jgi:hypothetical protein
VFVINVNVTDNFISHNDMMPWTMALMTFVVPESQNPQEKEEYVNQYQRSLIFKGLYNVENLYKGTCYYMFVWIIRSVTKKDMLMQSSFKC